MKDWSKAELLTYTRVQELRSGLKKLGRQALISNSKDHRGQMKRAALMKTYFIDAVTLNQQPKEKKRRRTCYETWTRADLTDETKKRNLGTGMETTINMINLLTGFDNEIQESDTFVESLSHLKGDVEKFSAGSFRRF